MKIAIRQTKWLNAHILEDYPFLKELNNLYYNNDNDTIFVELDDNEFLSLLKKLINETVDHEIVLGSAVGELANDVDYVVEIYNDWRED